MAGPNVLTPVYDSNVLMKAEGLELFRDIAGELHGNLPASVVFMVPHIVLMELQYKNDGSPETIRAAGAAYNYLTAPGRPARVRIQSHHTSKELENAFYPDYGPDRTGLFCQSLNGLKEARTLQPYNIRHPLGDDYHTWRGEGPKVRKPACQPLQASIAFPGAGTIRFTASDAAKRADAYRRIVDARRGAQWGHEGEAARVDTVEAEPACEQCGCGISAWHRVQCEEQLQSYGIKLFLGVVAVGVVASSS